MALQCNPHLIQLLSLFLNMRIGLYGGTFDPPHNAHLELAEWVRQELNLDYIYFIPAAIHAFKNNAELTPALIRYEMVQASIKQNEKFRVSRIEIDRENISFAVDTLRQFLNFENIADATLFYIIGYDNLSEFHLWKSYQSILKMCRVVLLRRSGEIDRKLISRYEEEIILLESPCINISATDIRKKISRGVDVLDSLPPAVLEVIQTYGLYKK